MVNVTFGRCPVINFIANLVGQMLDEAAPQSYIEHLSAPANVQSRKTRLDHHSRQFDFAGVTLRVNVFYGCVLGALIAGWFDITSAADNESIQPRQYFILI
jgi:hypothetical protein